MKNNNADERRDEFHDLEDLRMPGRFNQKLLQMKLDGNYIINPPQMEKFQRVCDFIQEAALEMNGKIEKIELIPKEGCGRIQAKFTVFDLRGAPLKRFGDINALCSDFTIDANPENGVSIHCNIPNVVVKKKL